MRKRYSWSLAIGLSLATGLLVLLTFSGAMASGGEVATYTIADPTGDWGFPTPYAHYGRGPGYTRMSFVFDTLVWKDDSGYLPALAENWHMEGDEVCVFQLRDDVAWHDGVKFTADDVVFTIDYTKEHPYQWVDNRIVDQAEKLDDYAVKLYLSEPYAPFVDEVAGTLPILPRHVWEGVDDPENFRDQEALTGTGPYTLDVDDYDKVQGTYRYRAYEGYYQGAPRVEEVIFVKVPRETAAAALTQGDVNAVGIEPEMRDQLGGFDILASSANGWNYKLMINHQKWPMSEKKFRQALAYAIDREQLVDIVGRCHGLIGSQGGIPPYSSWYNPDIEQYEHDPEKAKELLSKAGYDGEEVELLIMGGRVEYERLGELIREDLEKVGINVNLRIMDPKTVDSKVNEWDFDLVVSGHGGALGDPNFLAKMNTGWGFNSDRYTADEELNDLLEAQVRESDRDDRRDLIDQTQVLYAEDVPALILYYPEWFWAHDGEVDLYYTMDGVANGIPIPLNMMSFVG